MEIMSIILEKEPIHDNNNHNQFNTQNSTSVQEFKLLKITEISKM